MTHVREEVDRAIQDLLLSAEITAMCDEDAERFYTAIEATFSVTSGMRWIWEHFRFQGTARAFDDDRAFARLPLIVPKVAEPLVFLPGSDEDHVIGYRAEISAIARVLGRCSFFEYCIAPIDLEWLLVENHHGVVHAIGEPVESRLRDLQEP